MNLLRHQWKLPGRRYDFVLDSPVMKTCLNLCLTDQHSNSPRQPLRG